MSRYTFTSRLIDFAVSTANTFAAKQWLLENAPRMNKAEKIAADKAVVHALAKRYDVEPHESQRGVLSGFTLGSGSTPAGQALARARAILIGPSTATAAHTDPVLRAAKMLAKLTPAQAKRAFEKSVNLRAE